MVSSYFTLSQTYLNYFFNYSMMFPKRKQNKISNMCWVFVMMCTWPHIIPLSTPQGICHLCSASKETDFQRGQGTWRRSAPSLSGSKVQALFTTSQCLLSLMAAYSPSESSLLWKVIWHLLTYCFEWHLLWCYWIFKWVYVFSPLP